MISAQFLKKIKLIKAGGGRYVEGEWVDAVKREYSVSASVQTSSPREIERLPEGSRVKETKTLYLFNQLNVGSEKCLVAGDQVIINDQKWDVAMVDDYNQHLNLRHYKAIVQRAYEND